MILRAKKRGDPSGSDPLIVARTGACLSKRPLDQVSLCLMNRRMRTRMYGGVGRAG